jgi:Protein of unknown function (DUF3592)
MRYSLSWRGGPALFIVLGGIFVLISIVLVVFFVSNVSQLQRYQAGNCMITAKQLLQEEQHKTHTSNGHTSTTTTTVYVPDFQFTVQTADGRRYAARGYDALGTFSSDRSSQQALVDQYTVGKTYPCWYDPANPTQAVLTRQFNWFVFFIPGLFLFIGGLFVIIGFVLLRKRH